MATKPHALESATQARLRSVLQRGEADYDQTRLDARVLSRYRLAVVSTEGVP
jgi:hypothetical protein